METYFCEGEIKNISKYIAKLTYRYSAPDEELLDVDILRFDVCGPGGDGGRFEKVADRCFGEGDLGFRATGKRLGDGERGRLGGDWYRGSDLTFARCLTGVIDLDLEDRSTEDLSSSTYIFL